jgi:hypothetical protein
VLSLTLGFTQNEIHAVTTVFHQHFADQATRYETYIKVSVNLMYL